MTSLRGVEEAFSRNVARYAKRWPPMESLREGLSTLARQLYTECGRTLPGSVSRALADPGVPLIEVAHDGQLPHLGIVRLVLKAAQVAHLSQGMAVYLVGDHYTANMRPHNLFLGIPLRGKNPDEVKQPLRLPISGDSARVPFMCLPPLGSDSLERVYLRALHWIQMNIAYERSRGIRVLDAELIFSRLNHSFADLRRHADAALSMGDWLVRVQLGQLGTLINDPPLPLVVLPMSRFREVVREELRILALSSSRFGGDLRPGLWAFCPACRNRSRPDVIGDSVRLRCHRCAQTHVETVNPAGPNQFPDVVSFEAATLPLFAGWVVGSHAGYLPSIDRIFMERQRHESPPRQALTSVPTFRGVGEPKNGYGRSRLLRVSLEIHAKELQAPLMAPWEDNPHLTSPHLQG